MPPLNAQVKVRVQARGGKILGPAPTVRSTFTGSIALQPGIYEVEVVAVQANETNVGFAQTVVKV